MVESLEDKVRAAVKDIGYEQEGFHWKTADYACYLHAQSADIAMGVDAAGNKDEGAGDQGIMFGYATQRDAGADAGDAAVLPQHPERSWPRRATPARSRTWSRTPRARSPCSTRTASRCARPQIVLSTQHREGLTPADVADLVRPYILKVFPEGFVTDETDWHVNPTGNFVIGGPDGDCGLTGRKIIVDTYGGAAPHGGGAFSGKDPTKVDRSAAYACRYLAKNVVAAGLADKCTIQIGYAIGVVQAPRASTSTCTAPATSTRRSWKRCCRELIGGATPRAIREHLRLNRPIYARTAAYGHFGRAPEADGGFSWESTDLVRA